MASNQKPKIKTIANIKKNQRRKKKLRWTLKTATETKVEGETPFKTAPTSNITNAGPAAVASTQRKYASTHQKYKKMMHTPKNMRSK